MRPEGERALVKAKLKKRKKEKNICTKVSQIYK